MLDVSKEALRRDFEDTPEVIQSGLYLHTYIQEYDTPGGEPIGSIISNYVFDRSPQDIALLRNISKVLGGRACRSSARWRRSSSARRRWRTWPPSSDIGNYFDRAEYLKWKSFRDSPTTPATSA